MYTNQKDYLSDTQIDLLRLFATPVSRYDEDGNKLPSVLLGRRIIEAKAIQELNAPEHKIKVKKSDMSKRLLERVLNMIQPYFFTVTMNDKTLNEKDFLRQIKWHLKQANIHKWVLVTDYGEENGRLHFHGYIDLVGVNQDEIIPTPTKKYPLGLQLKRFSKNIGFNLGTPLYGSKKCIKKTINYTLKYIVKGDDLTFEHKMYASRVSKNDLLKDLPF